MPTWGQILGEINTAKKTNEKTAYDTIRRKYLNKLYQHTKNDTILYASNWTQSKQISPANLTINPEDIQGFMECIHSLKNPNLDLILHSPGGTATATESLVTYIRSKFKKIRVIIPHAAMSAATMFACAADEIVMGKHSFLGPIDPQFNLDTKLGPMSVPGQAILDQFKMAKDESLKDPRNLGVWLPIIEQYGPGLIIQVHNAQELSKSLVAEWLEMYMFSDDSEKKEKADKISKILSDHTIFKSHGRFIGRDKAESFGLKIGHLEDDQTLQDYILSVFHATTQTFDGTTAVKLIENHLGKAFVKTERTLNIPIRQIKPPEQPKKTPSRRERRQKK